MENFVFPDEIKIKFMEANCFVKNASLLTFDILEIFKERFTFKQNGVKATQLTVSRLLKQKILYRVYRKLGGPIELKGA